MYMSVCNAAILGCVVTSHSVIVIIIIQIHACTPCTRTCTCTCTCTHMYCYHNTCIIIGVDSGRESACLDHKGVQTGSAGFGTVSD